MPIPRLFGTVPFVPTGEAVCEQGVETYGMLSMADDEEYMPRANALSAPRMKQATAAV